MQRVTTPTHIFILDIDPREWDIYRITYKQCGNTVLEKTQDDPVSITEYGSKFKMEYRLTQEESKGFKAGMTAWVQIRAHYPDGKVVASKKCSFSVDDVFNTEILGGTP